MKVSQEFSTKGGPGDTGETSLNIGILKIRKPCLIIYTLSIQETEAQRCDVAFSGLYN
jgi:hypothetical protein